MPNTEISKNNSTIQWKPSSGNLLSEVLSNMAIVLIKYVYRALFSSILGGFFGLHCRFSPTCSCYAREAFKGHGFRSGLLMTSKRLLRCHPWGGHGYDPVRNEDQDLEAPKSGI